MSELSSSKRRCGTFVPRNQLSASDRRELRNYERYLRLWPRFKQRMLLRPRWQKYLGITPRQAWKYGKTLLKEEKLYWLIERGSPAEYLERESYGADYWTSDAHKALKFPTEAIAREFVAGTILSLFEEIRVCDHIFITENGGD